MSGQKTKICYENMLQSSPQSSLLDSCSLRMQFLTSFIEFTFSRESVNFPSRLTFFQFNCFPRVSVLKINLQRIMAAKNIGNINSLNFFKKHVHFREAFSGFRIQKQSTINKLYKGVLTLIKSNDTCKLFWTFSINPANIYLFDGNNRNTKKGKK